MNGTAAEYRKLPGKRRGFLNVSSVWAGPDHLLLVRGSRFREEYKRFYYRDVQAIAVARAPRFLISALALFAWIAIPIFAALFVPLFVPWTLPGFTRSLVYPFAGIAGAALAWIGAWVYISAAQSCRCRIYTAVSSDEFPSVYRIWTARKFLAAVEPLIEQNQGKMEGGWAMAAEERAVGPAVAAASPLGTSSVRPPLVPRRGLASDLFLAGLAADGLAKVLPLPAALGNWLPFILELVAVVGAVVVIVQHNRGRLRAGMHRVAVAALIAFGVLYYAQSVTASMSAGITAAKTGKRTTVAATFAQSRLTQQTGAGIDAILMIVGLIVSWRRDEDR